uniref:Uncharacterized protein n=1 Tax=Branchiostoma floridae TaxID=7739 RepID=C3ZQX6_BRAFL|eukprot:XP_002589006.1 hypothetical protein BRAFLDRAFT_87478 [Branchiostoma floridae]
MTGTKSCRACSLPVKGHPGPHGVGKCQVYSPRTRPRSEEEYEFLRRDKSVRRSLGDLHHRSRMRDFAKDLWSEASDSEKDVKKTIRDLRADDELKKEVDKTIDELLGTLTEQDLPRHSRQSDRDGKAASARMPSRSPPRLKSPPRVRRKDSWPRARDTSFRRDSGRHRGAKSGRRDASSSSECSSSSRSPSPRPRRSNRHRSSPARSPRRGSLRHRSGPSRSSRRAPRRHRSSPSSSPRRRSRRHHASSSSRSPRCSASRHRSHARSKSRKQGKSGRSYTINDNVGRKVKVSWPQWNVHFPGHGKGGAVTYDELTLPMFVCGFIRNVLGEHRMSSTVSSKLSVLADVMYDSEYYEWPVVHEMYASIMYSLEKGSFGWSDLDAIEGVRDRHYRTAGAHQSKHVSSSQSGARSHREPPVAMTTGLSGTRPRYCGPYQNKTCNHSSDHWDRRWGGQVKNICNMCLLVRNVEAKHPKADCRFNDKSFRDAPGDGVNSQPGPGVAGGRPY